MLRRIAALYVDSVSVYSRMALVECWDVRRDARLYEGPHPIVAHPPCGPWGSLAAYADHRDKSLALLAVAQVRRHGGVLEHPAGSRLWDAPGLWEAGGLPRPGADADEYGGFTLSVEQCAWGHVARKRTWVYCVAIDRDRATASVRAGGKPTHWISGSRKPRTTGGVCPAGTKFCSNQQRRRTPPAFAEWLVALARSVERDGAPATRPTVP